MVVENLVSGALSVIPREPTVRLDTIPRMAHVGIIESR